MLSGDVTPLSRERPRVYVKVERGSTFTYTRDLPYIVPILFTRVVVRTYGKLRGSGNPPLLKFLTDPAEIKKKHRKKKTLEGFW